MEKYYMDGTETGKEKVSLDGIEVLKKALASKHFEHDIDVFSNRAVVKVRNSGGTSMYLAKGGDDLFWLSSISSKKEKRGDWTWYTVRFEGQEIEVES